MMASFLLLVFLSFCSLAWSFRSVSIPTTKTSSSSLHATTTIIAGASGYIGKSVVREAVRRTRDKDRVIALVRNVAKAKSDATIMEFVKGAELVQCDVTNANQVQQVVQDNISNNNNDDDVIMVSCLASRSGVKKDAYLIDYQATLNFLNAGRAVCSTTTDTDDSDALYFAGSKTQSKKPPYFVLLSAFCVKNPTLQFQQAKLKFEAALTAQTDLAYSIVRPTAFFKSVSGQLEVVQSGSPFVMFGDGTATQCNPIAESDLATYLLDCPSVAARRNQILNLGGPDDPITMQQQGHMLFTATGMEPKFIKAPLVIFDVVIGALQFLATLTQWEPLEDAAETGRIGQYYAIYDMLTTDPKEKYGTITLQEHYNRIAKEGQEYDPYTTMFSRARGVDSKGMREEALQRSKEEVKV